MGRRGLLHDFEIFANFRTAFVSSSSAGQLHEILAHIEDLEAINSWMARADLAQAYHEPQRSTSDI